MRLLLDTCVIIDWLTDPKSISNKVWDIINEPRCKLYVSAETARELIVSFNNKRLLSKYWKTAEEMLRHHCPCHPEHITLPSSETRFWYYRNQGLELTEYRTGHGNRLCRFARRRTGGGPEGGQEKTIQAVAARPHGGAATLL